MTTDLVQLQNDLLMVMLSDPLLASINVVQLRKLRLQNEIDAAVIYTRTRNGRSGCGILVEMPTADCKNPNVSGPVLDLICTFLVAEQPAINMNPKTGTLSSAEDIVQVVLRIMHQWPIDGAGSFYAAPKPFEPVETLPGVIAYRVRFRLVVPQEAVPRVTCPTSSIADGLMTLACADGAAELRFTTDLTFPGREGGGNAGAQLYTEPFEVTSGDVIRFAAWRDGYNVSQVRRVTVP